METSGVFKGISRRSVNAVNRLEETIIALSIGFIGCVSSPHQVYNEFLAVSEETISLFLLLFIFLTASNLLVELGIVLRYRIDNEFTMKSNINK